MGFKPCQKRAFKISMYLRSDSVEHKKETLIQNGKLTGLQNIFVTSFMCLNAKFCLDDASPPCLVPVFVPDTLAAD